MSFGGFGLEMVDLTLGDAGCHLLGVIDEAADCVVDERLVNALVIRIGVPKCVKGLWPLSEIGKRP